MNGGILALLEQDPASGILAAADLREQRAKAATLGGWFARDGYVLCNSGDPTDGVNICAAKVENIEHIAAEANPAHALAAVRRWRGVVERHRERLPGAGICNWCIESVVSYRAWPCPDLTETADEARAYLGGPA